jgi:hypothetical protein
MDYSKLETRSSDGVANRIVDAVRARDRVVIVPARLWLMHVLRCMPTAVTDFAQVEECA